MFHECLLQAVERDKDMKNNYHDRGHEDLNQDNREQQIDHEASIWIHRPAQQNAHHHGRHLKQVKAR